MSEFRFRHYPELDGFRGLAVILVVVGHVLLFSLGVHSLLASLGVLLFFVLSGFLITGVLLNEKDARGRISLENFYLRRVLRLAPALLIFLAVVTALIYFGAIVDVSLVRGRLRPSICGEYRRTLVAAWPSLELVAGRAVLRDVAVVRRQAADPAAAVRGGGNYRSGGSGADGHDMEWLVPL